MMTGVTGKAFTFTIACAVFVQLLALVPVTVYVVDMVGFTLLAELVPKPLLHA